jgi:hypothetical protein
MLTRNVRWSGKKFGEFFDSKNQKIMEGTNLESSEEEEINLPELKTHNVQRKQKQLRNIEFSREARH